METRIAQVNVRAERYLVISRSLPAKRSELTPAEQSVFELCLKGESMRAIATARGASIRTIANQVQSVYRKLGVRARAELVRKFGVQPQNEA